MGSYRKYGDVDKHLAVRLYVSEGYVAVVRFFGSIPISSVRGWAIAVGSGRVLRKPGKPAFLQCWQDQTVFKVIQEMRRQGAAVDAGTILKAGNALRLLCGETSNLIRAWARFAHFFVFPISS